MKTKVIFTVIFALCVAGFVLVCQRNPEFCTSAFGCIGGIVFVVAMFWAISLGAFPKGHT